MSPTPLLLMLLLCATCYCSCPDFWTSFGASCYVFIDQRLTWYNAQALCKLLGSRLVEITNPSENAFVWNLLTSHGVVVAWIGINDIVQDGRWVFSTGKPLTYTNWAPGEPNNYKGRKENVGVMWYGGKWKDYPTTHHLPSVCQRSHR